MEQDSHASPAVACHRACLVLRGFALSRRMLARPGRAQDVVYCVEHARSACSTQYTHSGECRRREQAIVMEIRHIHRKYEEIQVVSNFLKTTFKTRTARKHLRLEGRPVAALDSRDDPHEV